ncbi:hypothetical protein BpHYR1_000780 [Brachionus plicatilis]|uniref:Uncharacterized protein n=1 Tax=Brachionus plicatilis TaxID=10195 RepID=A0A3M7QMY8_BRAPC|nr:hypothetical protein BpHYR1_000780 [Brachionus plicatilis]
MTDATLKKNLSSILLYGILMNLKLSTASIMQKLLRQKMNLTFVSTKRWFTRKINFTKIDNIFYSVKEKILLETYLKEHECDMVLLKTNDDIFITSNNTAQLKIDEKSIYQLIDITLADTDYKVFNLFKKLKTMMSVKFCCSIMALLKSFRGSNKINRINDQYGNDLNILAEKEELYKLECISLTRLTFNNISIECYSDMQIIQNLYGVIKLNYTQMETSNKDQLNLIYCPNRDT